MNSVFDPEYSGIARAKMYQAWAAPDLFPDEPQPVLSNWHEEDLATYVGRGYIN